MSARYMLVWDPSCQCTPESFSTEEVPTYSGQSAGCSLPSDVLKVIQQHNNNTFEIEAIDYYFSFAIDSNLQLVDSISEFGSPQMGTVASDDTASIVIMSSPGSIT
ncbi:hypothetical protein BDQ17DRAFT_1420816 [Cyathus striatus]|nr:hypothetical protein BDQ17DRAFT_1420816 [Cyathus striatus]